MLVSDLHSEARQLQAARQSHCDAGGNAIVQLDVSAERANSC